MNLIVNQLQQDHCQMVRILYHLDQEILALGGLGKIGRKARLENILNILDYLQVYPEMWHHPVEDLLCEVLMTKAIPDTGALESCMQEHSVLELLTENLHSYLEQLAIGKEELRARVVKAGSDFVNRQLMHMEQEQNILFPLLENYLGADDWDVIKARMKDCRAGLERAHLQHYQSLFQTIASASVVTAP